MESDAAEAVSECIIFSQSTSIGTGAFMVVRSLIIEIDPRDLVAKGMVFEEAYVTI